jgi:FAD/FMN-containing dehydrogenase
MGIRQILITVRLDEIQLMIAAAKPDVVVYAESTEDVAAVMKLAYQYRVPVTPFSGGTSLEGNITCPYGGICIDLSRMDQILEVHVEDSDAVVQAGVQWEALNENLRERGLKLFFPLDPGPSACIGGMMATGCRWVMTGYSSQAVVPMQSAMVQPKGNGSSMR